MLTTRRYSPHTQDWLRPIEDVAGAPGRPPRTVWLATGLCANSAVAAAAMAWTLTQTAQTLIRPPAHLVTTLVALSLTAVSVALLAVFAAGVVAIRTRGWCRLPGTAGLTLGVLALFGMTAPMELVDISVGAGDALNWAAAWYVAWRLAPIAASGLALWLVLRTRSASVWLARRRYEVRRSPR